MNSDSDLGHINFIRHDDVTGLPNRILFTEILQKAISNAKRHHKLFAVLLIDLVPLNHCLNDFILKQTAEKFLTILRTEDTLAKLDDDQFAILLTDVSKPKFASIVAQKLLALLQSSTPINPDETLLSANIGICAYPFDGENIEELFTHADAALFSAKQMGNNHYQFYSEELDSESREFIALQASLRQALQNQELLLYYQPLLNLKKGSISGVEALIRWQHPQYGLLGPDKIIPIAEEIGLINEIGNWVLKEACKTNKHWQDEGYEHITVSINLSPKQFYHPEIAKTINSILLETGINPSYVELEINEATVMLNIDDAAKQLHYIKSTGVRISLDHFGTGYTSISHLKLFPINTIKIDPSFVKGVPLIPNDTVITHALIGLAHNLGITVVAQGVETSEQVKYLSENNCDIVQGFFLSLPTPADKVILQLRKLSDFFMLY